METLHRKDLMRLAAKRAGVSQQAADAVMDAVAVEIALALAEEIAVVWTGFVKFTPRSIAARRGVNPRTGEHIAIPDRRVIGITSSNALRERVAAVRAKRANASG